jgi:hypothetical protein
MVIFIDHQPQTFVGAASIGPALSGVGVEYACTMAHHAPQSAMKPQKRAEENRSLASYRKHK